MWAVSLQMKGEKRANHTSRQRSPSAPLKRATRGARIGRSDRRSILVPTCSPGAKRHTQIDDDFVEIDDSAADRRRSTWI
jgi:hypothetical protein